MPKDKLNGARYAEDILFVGKDENLDAQSVDGERALEDVQGKVASALRSGRVSLERDAEGPFKTGFKDFEQSKTESVTPQVAREMAGVWADLEARLGVSDEERKED